ncbi:hypothetical protein BDN70DRAFT_887614 [Pholiota conissans]|uniref:Uncharacterized protein n=1 Tax=Pholiota conissans TaxID=109636 RepID=A0A9P5YMG6_9AGAR|nr:hypothetical protein BDN70DRAFT_887614 [Pholiota conissans]
MRINGPQKSEDSKHGFLLSSQPTRKNAEIQSTNRLGSARVHNPIMGSGALKYSRRAEE